MARKAKPPAGKSVDALRHGEATRRNIPTAEYQSVIQKEAEQPLRVAYSNLRYVELTDGTRRELSREEVFGLTRLPQGAQAYRPNPPDQSAASPG
jgi:hypothetical protein